MGILRETLRDLKRAEARLKEEDSDIKWRHVVLFIIAIVAIVMYADHYMKHIAKTKKPEGIAYIAKYGCVPTLKEFTGNRQIGGGGKTSRYERTEVRTFYDCHKHGSYVWTEYRELSYEQYYQIKNWGKK